MNQMMKQLSFILLALVLFASTGCRKFLEANPDNRVRPGTVEDYQAIVTGAYPEAFHLFTELYTDNFRFYDYPDFNNANINSWLKPIYLWSDEYITGNAITPEAGWRKYYNSIYKANVVLEGIDEAAGDDALRRSVKGEALLIRAYAHFMLVNIFAKHYNPATAATDPGVPYSLETEKKPGTPYKRNTVQEVYDLAEKDALEGLALINDAYMKVPKHHFNKNAAHAFMSRFYLFKGDFEKCIEYSEKVLAANSSVRDLLSDWDKDFAIGNYTEFAQAYCSVSKPNILMMQYTLEWNSFYMSGLYANEFRSTFSSDDIRGRLFTYTSNQTPNYWCRKFRSARLDGQQYSDVALFVVEEVMYNAAEAHVRKANPDMQYAVDMLNTIRIKRLRPYTALKVSDFATSQALLEKIIDDKRRELCYEGYRWFDIKRFDIPVTHWNGVRDIELPPGDPRRIFQIPYAELNANPDMEPNPR
jgi:hypothetical protein